MVNEAKKITTAKLGSYIKMIYKKVNPRFLNNAPRSLLNTILSTVLFLLSCQTVLAVEIKTTVDRNPVSINESFQITFTATQSPDGEPDFSPLEKDFNILGTSQEDQFSWRNGKSSGTTQWVLDVSAKQPGNILIPPISFGDDLSQASKISINKSTAPKQDKDLFLEVDVSTKTPYVQEQVIYTLRFFQKVQTASVRMKGVELKDAIIERLDEEKSYTTQLNGSTYKVTELKYAIFPQKSGSNTISPVILSADAVVDNQPRFNGFFNRPRTQNVQISSKEITLEIQPAPKDFKNKYWLPSEHVHLEEKWSGDITQMKAGEPLTRTITLLAKGANKTQLPKLHKDLKNAALKTYPDQPVLKENTDANGFIAFREEKIAYIPSKAGSYTLAAVEIPWFNTQTKKMEIAKIPEQKITVAASAQSTENQVQTPSATSTATPQINTTQAVPIVRTVEDDFWKWLSLFLASGWLTTALYFFFKKPKPEKERLPVAVNPKELKLEDAIKALKKACKENNQIEAKNALLAWGRVKYNETSLSSIALHCASPLQNEILALNRNLYTHKTENWDSQQLLQVFSDHTSQEKEIIKTDDALEPLYKI